MLKRNLTILPTILLPFGIIAIGFVAVLHSRPTVSRVEAATINTKASQSSQPATTVTAQAPDVTVNGQQISVPLNSSVTTNLNDGGRVQVTTSQNGESGSTSIPSDSSVQVSAQVENQNQSNMDSHTEVFSSSSVSVSTQSSDQVYSTGTSSVQVTH